MGEEFWGEGGLVPLLAWLKVMASLLWWLLLVDCILCIDVDVNVLMFYVRYVPWLCLVLLLVRGVLFFPGAILGW